MAIKFTAFMTAYKFKKTDEEKEQMVKEHINHDYVPYEKKADIAKAIADACYWQKEKDADGNEYKILHVDSVAKYMCTCMAMFDLYTDIERKKGGSMLEDFNTLNSAGILDLVIQNIDQRELKEFNMIVQLTCDDVVANEYENHAYITKQVERFGKLIGTALLPVLQGLDMGKVQEVINQIGG